MVIQQVAEPDDTSVLHTVNLGKRYRKRWAVSDLTLTVNRGEVFGFLGPNGAGKSTTIRMILSLIRPTKGSVTMFGKPLLQNRKELLARVGGLVERPDFYLYLTARRNLSIAGALRGGVTMHEIDEVLDIVGLLSRADDKVKTFSHGMKQRLGIAQALLGRPDLIVLDEPTSGLDPQGIKEVRELIQHLSTEQSMTIFLSSHLLGEIEQTATSMAIINRGSLIIQGKVKDLLADSENVVTVEGTPEENALAIVRSQHYAREVKQEGTKIRCVMSRAHIPAMTRALVEAGISVSAVVPKRSLEEYFLTITEGASDVGTGGRKHMGTRARASE